MRASTTSRILALLAGLATVAMPILPTFAQYDRPMQLRGGGDIGFRDENGRIWTPDNVGQPDTKPVPPEDRAFDPRRQVVAVPDVSVQVPRLEVVGTVPIVSRPGSSVPIVTLETPSLRLIGRARWVATLLLANNGERTIDAEITCRFGNDSSLVEAAKVVLRGVEPGQRVAAVARGPSGLLYVNNAVCAVDSPLQ